MFDGNITKIDILGTEYTIKIVDTDYNPVLEEVGGYTDGSIKTIVILSKESHMKSEFCVSNIDDVMDLVLRHEIIHAFLIESGLNGNGSFAEHWETNEEMVDWMAIQFPKILRVFIELKCI